LPDLGSGLVEATVVEWYVAVGDVVEEGQTVADVETEKSVISLPSPFAGRIAGLGAAAGAALDVGAPLLVVDVPGDDASAASDRRPTDAADAPAGPAGTAVPASTIPPSPDPSAPAGPPATGRGLATPLVRRLARQHDLDLAAITGTGRGGIVTRRDVEAAVSARAPGGTSEPGAPAASRDSAGAVTPPAPTTGDSRGGASAPSAAEGAPAPPAGGERHRMSPLRRTIAERMARSWREIPHITSHDLVDCAALLDARRRLSDRLGRPVPIEALLIKGVVPVLREFPQFNAVVDGEDVVHLHEQHVAVAVDTPDGLLAPVVHRAGELGVQELSERVLDLAERARARTLRREELAGATFTVSNIGASGGGSASVVPIVPLPTTAILSVGRAEQRAVVRDGQIVAAWVLPLDVSCDHRVIDGADVRRFVARVREVVEEPLLLAR
jgi:pyruvate dehydrogenase E2 component (dihydrolipoamide acetyltransferase)